MTARVGLVGFPLAHSLSPLLHRTLYRLAGIDATYDLWEFPPEAFPADFGSQVKGGWQGLNVTTPHKEAVIPHCDVLSEGAGAIGAVNHLWVDPRGRLVGDNKDIDGAYFTLQGIAAANPAWPIARFQEMHLIGLGPAARAVVLGFHRFWRAERARLKRPPGQDPGRGVVVVYLRDIRPEHHGWLERLAPDLTDDVALVGLKPLTVLDDGDASGLLVHATSSRDAPPWTHLPSGDYGVWDLNYASPTTPWVAAARQDHRYAVDGLPMLVWQGFFSAARWFPGKLDPRAQLGLTKPVMEALRAALESSG